jgi:gluconolactonase
MRTTNRRRSNTLIANIAVAVIATAAAHALVAQQTLAPRPAAPTAAPAAAPGMRGDGPAPTPAPFRIERLDPKLDALVAADAKLDELARGFGLNEGPVWVPEGDSGYLLVGGLLDNVIYKIAADNTVSVFLERAGYTGNDVSNAGTQTRSGRSHVLLIGPSCASLDSQGRLIWCADNDRTVMRLEKDGTRTVLSAGAPDGKRFSGPNDIYVARDDAVWLTDNDFGLRGAGASPDKQMPNGIWRIKDGRSTLVLGVDALGGIPNGIALSPDERYLYLTALQKIMRYEVRPDGTLGAGSLFTQGPGIGDGMKVDVDGNLYSTSGAGPGIVRITAPTGTLLGYLHLPIIGGEPKKQICATNIAFGDRDGKGLYITACDAVYRIRMKVAGVMPGPPSQR